ncbi:hypothetical protein ACOY98_22165 [Aeromonas hydrophila]|uniref:hypothetical protein n=1 Tax=Aeromonas hydrophila TaxID=644 RepID=UPI003BEB281C
MSSELRKRLMQAGASVPYEWDVVPLEALLKDGKSISVGVMYPGPHTPGGTPLIKVGDIKGGLVTQKPEYCISSETDELHQRTRLHGDELLITLVGNPGECVVVEPCMAGWNPARAIAVIRLANPGWRIYLKAVLESAASKHLIDSVLNTTVQKTLNLKDIRQLPIPLPPEKVIQSLSDFSDVLSKRISLLRETNATLEAIAQALFKSWFVDFDPVHACARGEQPAGLAPEVATLFPDSFEESELGMIPKGWKLGTIGDFAEQKKGSVNPLLQPETLFEHFSLPAFDNQQTPVLELGTEIKSNKTPLPKEAVLLSKLNPHIPRLWLPIEYGGAAVCSTEFLAYSPKGASSKEFIYCAFSSEQFIQHLCQLVTGTSNSHQRVKPDQVLLVAAVLPSDEVFKQFELIANPLFAKVHENRKQAQTLATLRDTLLPRLISGQLRLPEAEEQLSEAGLCQ